MSAARHFTRLLRGIRSSAMIVAAVMAAMSASGFVAPPALAQTPTADGKKPLIVEGREVIYDNDKNTVSAKGDVVLYYDGKKLIADRVIYDRNSKRVFAEGNVKVIEAGGLTSYGDRFELTDDFRDGFVDSLRVITKDKERFSAPRAERIDGDTVFERGIYTPCEACKDNPERPPLWQVRAARIIHKSAERTVYYENASVEFFGVPVAWFPFLSAPDATVNRRSGFLAPRFLHTTNLGYGTRLSYFWEIAPNMDLTFSPTLLSRQGFLGEVEWRHRLEYGYYTARFSGIKQADPKAFALAPLGPGNEDFRGSFESVGKFNLSQNWTLGWDVALATDKYFFQNYKIRSESISQQFAIQKNSTSQIYLNGQSERSWFDARGYYFRSTSYLDWQKQIPVVGPVIDYNRRFSVPGIGGELSLTSNVTNVSREQAHFVEIKPANIAQPQRLWSLYGLYDGCLTYSKDKCLLRGFAGNYARISTDLSWRRQFIDPIGQVWTPFAGVRLDGAWKNVNTSTTGFQPINTGAQAYSNLQQTNFLDVKDNSVARFMPNIGLEYRFPFVAVTSWATHIVEPIGQIVVRPDETKVGKLPNEDAQSLVFDDTTLFSANKFSGFDRIEGGTRANVGLQYTATFKTGGYLNVLFGQSYQLAGKNSFSTRSAQADLAGVGGNSGLDKNKSDLVGRITYAPDATLNFTARGRFDPQAGMAAKRIDLIASKTVDLSLTEVFSSAVLSATYSRIAPQPLAGYDQWREGVQLSGTILLKKNWFALGTAVFDLDRHRYNVALNQASPTTYPNPNRDIFNLSSLSMGLGYRDECTAFSAIYTTTYLDRISGQRQKGQTIMLRLELKNLGQYKVNQSLGSATSNPLDPVIYP